LSDRGEGKKVNQKKRKDHQKNNLGKGGDKQLKNPKGEGN